MTKEKAAWLALEKIAEKSILYSRMHIENGIECIAIDSRILVPYHFCVYLPKGKEENILEDIAFEIGRMIIDKEIQIKEESN